MSPVSFDHANAYSKTYGRSPLSPLQNFLTGSSEFITRARKSAGQWFLDTQQDRYDSEDSSESAMTSVIKLLAEGGCDEFLTYFDFREDQKKSVPQFITDIVRVEWQFAQLVAMKPENEASYQSQLRRAYAQIVDEMKAEIPTLPWVSRSRVGASLAA